MYNTVLAYVRPLLEYCAQVWSAYYKKDIDCLEKIQHRRQATKLVRYLKNLPFHDRLTQLNLCSLEYRRLRGTFIETYKTITNQEKVNRDQFFILSETSHLRGHSKKIYKHSISRICRQKFFSQAVIDELNQLPENVIATSGYTHELEEMSNKSFCLSSS